MESDRNLILSYLKTAIEAGVAKLPTAYLIPVISW